MSLAHAEDNGIFDQREAKVAKWQSVYVDVCRTSGSYGGVPSSLNESAIGYMQVKGKFGYGIRLTSMGDSSGNSLKMLQTVASIRPDWDLTAEPSLELAFGTVDLTGSAQNTGLGTSASAGLRVEIYKSTTFSTGAVIRENFLNTNAPGIGNSILQSVGLTFSVNIY